MRRLTSLLLTVGIFGIVSSCSPDPRAHVKEGYGRATWGMSKRQVAAIFSADMKRSTGGIPGAMSELEFEDDIAGVDVFVVPQFYNDSLFGVTIRTDSLSYTDAEHAFSLCVSKIIPLMQEKYGTPAWDTSATSTAGKPRVLLWNTNESRITLFVSLLEWSTVEGIERFRFWITYSSRALEKRAEEWKDETDKGKL